MRQFNMAAMAVLACASLALVACSATPRLNAIVLEDAHNARLLAESADDALATMCWSYIEGKVEARAIESPKQGELSGVLSAYQTARNVRRTVTGTEVSDEFRLNCGPMLIESAGALGRLGVRVVPGF